MICMQCGAETPSENRPCVACGRIPTTDYPSPPAPASAEAATNPVPAYTNPAPAFPPPSSGYSFPPPANAYSPGGSAVMDVPAAPYAAASLEPLQEAAPYKPSGRSGPGGVALLWLTALIAGPIAGLIYDKVSGYFNIFLISPILIGLVVGGALYLVIKKINIRSPLAAITAGIAAGLLCAGANYIGDCLAMRSTIVNGVSQDIADHYHLPVAQVRAKIDRRLDPIREIRVASEIKAESGVSITSTHDYSHSGGTPIQGGFYYALEVFEAILMAGAAAAVAAGASSALFCETCEKWYTSHKIFRVHPSRSAAMLHCIKTQDWNGAAALPGSAPGTEKMHCDVVVKRCPACRASLIEVTNVVDKATKKLLTAPLPQEASAKLAELGRLPSA
ncbi:hypothetical protein CCAX7_16370 [Capsulimonas corticalis]|uniref:Uncharacterized protein n=1 Tax=Capsulimonas corticalis TaxID=2219043 RepID=A0A402CZ24_9BACT|nr:hypothetical protein [Capsulimonas corticalis]BDI29586.1 hypothetical protein CCAX7_16370 [Capsulimonas corticalis]